MGLIALPDCSAEDGYSSSLRTTTQQMSQVTHASGWSPRDSNRALDGWVVLLLPTNLLFGMYGEDFERVSFR
jgi:hypothetical protein